MFALALIVSVASIVALYSYAVADVASDYTQAPQMHPVGDWSTLLQELAKPVIRIEKIAPLSATQYTITRTVDGRRVSGIVAGKNVIAAVCSLLTQGAVENFNTVCAAIDNATWNHLGQQIGHLGQLSAPLRILENTFQARENILDTCDATL